MLHKWDIAKLVRHLTLNQAIAGSNPAIPIKSHFQIMEVTFFGEKIYSVKFAAARVIHVNFSFEKEKKKRFYLLYFVMLSIIVEINHLDNQDAQMIINRESLLCQSDLLLPQYKNLKIYFLHKFHRKQIEFDRENYISWSSYSD